MIILGVPKRTVPDDTPNHKILLEKAAGIISIAVEINNSYL